MKTICFVIPYFGCWPEWIDLFFTSCAYNPSIQWIFITDCEPRSGVSQNVRFETMTWSDCMRLLRDKCGVSRGPTTPYKICDYRMTYGHVFESLLVGYDFWGFGDIDVIYGDLRSFLTPDVLTHDLITFNRTHLSGHFTLVSNQEKFSKIYQLSERWKSCAGNPEYRYLDENIGYYGIDDVYAIESYNTPLSPYIPWTNGEFFFPRYWFYHDGRLYNNLNGDRHFMYLHFMWYKYRWIEEGRSNVVHLEPGYRGEQWKLCLDGFWSYLPDDQAGEHGSGIRVSPRLNLSGR